MIAKILSLAAMVLSSAAVAAPRDKFDVTPEEHAACDQDATSLCADSYPDPDKLLACLRANRAQLSPPCARAFRSGLKRRHLAP